LDLVVFCVLALEGLRHHLQRRINLSSLLRLRVVNGFHNLSGNRICFSLILVIGSADRKLSLYRERGAEFVGKATEAGA
jgi:hypothetical protein